MEVSIFGYSMAACVAGIPTAWAFGKYILAVEKRKPISAAMWDIAILGLSSIVTLTLWSMSGDSPFVFLGWTLGNATGTYLVVKRAQKRD